MKNVLLISNISLKKPVRGTPIRIHEIALQIKNVHRLCISAKDVEEELMGCFISFPETKNWLKKTIFFVKLIQRKKIDVVLLATENSIKLAVMLKFLTGVKTAIDLHGVRAEEIFFQGNISFLKKWYLDITTKFYLLSFDLVLTVSEKLKSYYRRFNNNISVIYGGVDVRGVPVSAINNSNDSHSVFTIGYTGNVRSYQGIDFLLKALQKIRRENRFNFKLKLVLSGEKDSIISKIGQSNLEDVTTINFNVPHYQVYETLLPSDVLVIPRPSFKMTEFAYPSKTTEYLLTGVPVIMTKVGPVEELFEDHDISIIINPDDIAHNLEKAIVQVYNMSENDRQKLGNKAINFVERNLTWDKIGHKVNRELDRI